MEKKSVEIEDFLQDEEFLLWVKKPSVESSNYWKAWMENNPEHVPAMLKARELVLSITFRKKTPEAWEKDEVLGNIIKKLGDANYSRYSRDNTSWSKKLIKVAASLALIISVALYYLYEQNLIYPEKEKVIAASLVVKETPPGVKLQTVLPDGSKIWLNADSKVSYDHCYGQKDRKIYLTGEAYFEVEKDETRPFIVQSGSLTTTALGTSFNIRSLAGSQSSEVALVTGKVEVEKDGNTREKVVLIPGQKVVHNSSLKSMLKSDFQIEDAIGWKNGILVFDNASFNEIREMLERWYGVKISSELSKGGEWNYTGKFDNQSLELVLQRLAFIKGFRFRIEENNVYLYN